MRHHLLDEIATQKVIAAGAAPAACLGLAYRDGGGWRVYTGAAGSLDGPGDSSMRPMPSNTQPVDPTSPFDLASVSKPFLAVLCARLRAQGMLDWAGKLSRYLPETAGTPAGEASLERLLSHRAGLMAHLQLYDPLMYGEPLQRGRALRRAALARRPECTADSDLHPPLYSDLGYILVGEALQRLTGIALDELLATHVCAPLALDVGSARQWLRKGNFKARVVPTELVPWRGGQLVGVVHDDNCWALHGHGFAGHAGLFASVEPLLEFGAVLVDALSERHSFLERPAVEHLVQPRSGGSLRCGFDGKATRHSSAGLSAGEHTFGHLGFTGTSLWCDPDAAVVTVLLTNRVNPSRLNLRIRAVRPLVHELLFRLGREPGPLMTSCNTQ